MTDAEEPGVATEVLTKESVENRAPDSLSLSFAGVSDVLLRDESRLAQLMTSLCEAFATAAELGFTPAQPSVLVITGAFAAEVKRWQRELGHAEGVTDRAEGVAAGKTLSWLGRDGNPRSIVVIDQTIAYALTERHEQAKHLVAHELAHVYDNAMWLALEGERSHPDYRDWPAIRAYFARMTWGEYFAEMTASRKAVDGERVRHFEEAQTLAIALLTGVRTEFTKAIRKWWNDRDTVELWQQSSGPLSSLLCQLGRCLGFVASLDANDEQVARLAANAENAWHGWGGVVTRLHMRLAGVSTAGRETISEVEDVIEFAYHRAGLTPRQTQDGGIWVGVEPLSEP